MIATGSPSTGFRKPYLESIDSVRGLGSIFADIARMFDAADYSPTMQYSADLLQETHQQTYDAMTEPDGTPWAPNAPSTVARKGHGIILVEKHRLKPSVLEPSHPDHVQEIMPDGRGLTWGSSVPYGVVHQEGTLAPRVPQRPFMGMTEKTIDQITNAVADKAVDSITYRGK